MVKTRPIKKKLIQPIRVEDWTNNDTGETKSFTVIPKETNESVDVNWWKVWLPDLLVIMGAIGNKKIKVLKYILDNISPYDNSFGGTIREIAENTKTSKGTVQRVLDILTDEVDFLVKVRVGYYQINPNILAKGKNKKRMGLMIEYEKRKIVK